MRTRTVSYAIAYLLLMVAAFVADAVLVVSFMGFVSGVGSALPRIVSEFSSGLVEGAYSIAPYVSGSAVVTGLDITLLNPNPVPVDVVIVGYYPSALSSYKVLDLGGLLGIRWDGGRPPGVEVVDLRGQEFPWFQGARKALRMMPHAYASFTLPAWFGVPAEVLACTRVGCVKLSSVGASLAGPVGSAPWVIQQLANPPPPGVRFSQVWTWRAVTYGGFVAPCVAEVSGSKFNVSEYVACCRACPPGTRPADVKLRDAGACSEAAGGMVSWSVAHGLPPTVIAGYYSTDPHFKFEVPKWITVAGKPYRLYGVSPSTEDLTGEERQLITTWLDYTHQECLVRVVEIAGFFTATDRNGHDHPLSDIWPDSNKIYIYAGVKGYETSVWGTPYEIGNATILIYGIKPGYEFKLIGKLTSLGEFVDNSAYLENPKSEDWVMDPTAYIGVRVVVIYTLRHYESPLLSDCFKKVFGVLQCGATYGDWWNLAFGFYIELIPSQYLKGG